MTCAKCNQTAVEKIVATRTKTVGDHVIVEAQRRALVCGCGVIAWDPPLPARPSMPPPYAPDPFVPIATTPYRPWDQKPYAPTRPQITCSNAQATDQNEAVH